MIVRYDGKEVENTAHLRNMVAATAPGTEVKVGILRNGKEETLTLRVGTLTPQMTAEATPSEEGGALSKLGMSVQTLTPDLAKQFGIRGAEGAVITDVEEGGPASLAGLQPGDVIVEADRQKVASAGDLQEALDNAKDKDTVLMLIKRKGASLFVVIRMK